MKLISETTADTPSARKEAEKRLRKQGYIVTKWHVSKGMATPEVKKVK